MKLIAYLIMAVPFVFGALRLGTTGFDARYLWVACAATLGALTGMLRAAPGVPATRMRTLLTFLAATAAAVVASVLLGARSVPSVAVVSVAFSLCITIGLALRAFAQKR
jgi:hypothetical protein